VPNIQIFILAIVQGITEFLPISSSAHLILVPQLLGFPDQGREIDVAAHVGTLIAVVLYFWRDIGVMLRGLVKLSGRRLDPGLRLVGLLLIGTVPALIIGFLLERYAGEGLRSPAFIAYALIFFGLILYGADKLGLTVRRIEHVTATDALIIGIFQCLAFIPGTSRSGITMTVARLMGYERPDAARFSFLLSIPTIAAAGLYEGYKLFKEGDAGHLREAGLMVVLSAIAGFLAIAFMMYWVRRASFLPFVIYRVALGFALLYLVYTASPLLHQALLQ